MSWWSETPCSIATGSEQSIASLQKRRFRWCAWTREEERLGGAANAALNVKTLGGQATLLTVVGDDEPARTLRRLLEQQGVAALLGSDPLLYTIVKLRVIGRAQQLLRIDFENLPNHEVLAGLLGDYDRVLPNHDTVLFSDYGKGGLTHIRR